MLWLAVNGVTAVNIYREPQFDTTLEILFAWSIPSQCIIAGDFNARHHTWQLGRSHGHGNSIASWASENDLSLLNPIDTPTNAHGNTIDLAFSNIALAQATVEDHLATSSDHFTLSISLPALTPAKLPKGKILLATDDELKRYTAFLPHSSRYVSARPRQTGGPTAVSGMSDLLDYPPVPTLLISPSNRIQRASIALLEAWGCRRDQLVDRAIFISLYEGSPTERFDRIPLVCAIESATTTRAVRLCHAACVAGSVSWISGHEIPSTQ